MALSQSISFGGLKFIEHISMITHHFIINYNKNIYFGNTFIADVDYPECLQSLHKDLLFSPETIAINKRKKWFLLF